MSDESKGNETNHISTCSPTISSRKERVTLLTKSHDPPSIFLELYRLNRFILPLGIISDTRISKRNPIPLLFERSPNQGQQEISSRRLCRRVSVSFEGHNSIRALILDVEGGLW